MKFITTFNDSEAITFVHGSIKLYFVVKIKFHRNAFAGASGKRN